VKARKVLTLLVEVLIAFGLVVALLHGNEGHWERYRWGLLFVALLVTLVLLRARAAIWLDVLLFAIVMAGAVVIYRAATPPKPTTIPTPAPRSPRATFVLPQSLIDSAGRVEGGRRGIVILLDPSGSGSPHSYEQHRYEAVFGHSMVIRRAPGNPKRRTIRVLIDRGAQDATAATFAAQLAAATKIVVLSNVPRSR
jgi:hypothetical protein